MGRYRRVLVAFDGSDSSRNALTQAIGLAVREKAWVKVVAVVPPYEGDLDLTGVKDVDEALRGPAKKLLAEAVNIASAQGVSVITNIEEGEAYERIVDVADAENCDIIVMGRRGHHRIERALVGSVTARVIGHTHRDVLVVPRDTAVRFDKVLLAVDGSKFSEPAVDHAIALAAETGAALSAVSVAVVNDEFYAEAPDVADGLVKKARAVVDAVREKAGAKGVKVETSVREGEAYEEIVDTATKSGAGLIIMGSHGRTGLKRLLMGSVTEKVIGHAPCPVLVARS